MRDTAYVYFIRGIHDDDGSAIVKIGYSGNVPARFWDLAKAHPFLDLEILGTYRANKATAFAIEKRFHKIERVALGRKQRSEWYPDSPRIHALFDLIKAGVYHA